MTSPDEGGEIADIEQAWGGGWEIPCEGTDNCPRVGSHSGRCKQCGYIIIVCQSCKYVAFDTRQYTTCPVPGCELSGKSEYVWDWTKINQDSGK